MLQNPDTSADCQHDAPLRCMQGSEGSRERQLEALHGELEVARGEREAARREASALQAANAELQVGGTVWWCSCCCWEQQQAALSLLG